MRVWLSPNHFHMMCSTEAQSVMRIDKAERKALPSFLSAQLHSYAMCIMEMTEEFSNVSCCPKKIYIDPKTKELGFYLTLSIVRPVKTFNLCKSLVKLWKCQSFCQQHMMINSPCIQFFVRDKVISSKDHILEILQNQFNLIFWISNCIICFKSICSQGNCCGATGVSKALML